MGFQPILELLSAKCFNQHADVEVANSRYSRCRDPETPTTSLRLCWWCEHVKTFSRSKTGTTWPTVVLSDSNYC